MITISPVGWFILIVLLLWPVAVSLLFIIFLRKDRNKFFVSSSVIGLVVYYAPVVLMHAGAFDRFDSDTVDKLQLWKLSFPIITTIFVFFYWHKMAKPKQIID